MGLKVKTVALISILDAENKITAYEALNHYTFAAEAPGEEMIAASFTPKEKRDPITAEEFAAISGDAGSKMADAHKADQELIAELNRQIAVLTEAVGEARAALLAVAKADEEWDSTPRSQVADILAKLG